jgi:TolB protein
MGILGMGQFRLRKLAFLFLLLSLSACNFPANQKVNPLQTAIAQTLEAATQIATSETDPEEETDEGVPADQQDSESPQGKIVYVCQYSKLSGVNQICMMDADSADQRILTPPSNSDNFFPSISSDGLSVYFSSDRTGRYQIYRLELQSNEIEQLTYFTDLHAYAPTESPDGSMIVFYARESGEDYPQSHNLWLMNADGSDPQALTDLDGGAWDPAWSPGGRKLLFASEIIGIPQIFILDLDSEEIEQVTQFAGIRGRNDWSANGLMLSTYIGTSWDRDIFTFDLQGGNLQQLTDGGNNLAPSFSPDGNWIVFMSYRDHLREDLGCEIYIMRSDGSDPLRLTENDICDWQPRWGS